MRILDHCGRFLLLVSLFCLACPKLIAAEGSIATKDQIVEELEHIDDTLSKVTHSLKSDRARLTTLEKSLQALEKDIKLHFEEQIVISAEIITLKEEVDRLQKQKDHLKKQVSKHQHLLAQNLAAIYTPRSNSEIKLLLNQKDSSQLRRSLGLYGYLQNAQRDAILQSISTLQTVSDIEQQALHQQQLLGEKQQKLNVLAATLTSETNKRKKLIDTLKTSISEKSLSRQALHQRQKDLKNLLADIGDNLIKESETASMNGNIIAAQGHLAWPTALGHLDHPTVSLTKNRGLLIKAAANTPVKAIYPGKVVFADWLKGYGLLIIVEHGNNFMSLYAYNNQLLKHPGEQVLQGDTIAIVGDPDQNPDEINLYFELRDHGESVNPYQWLSERG